MIRHPAKSEIVIRPIEPAEALQARQLILDGLRERWGELDLSRSADLDNIPAKYQSGVFLVAVSNSTVLGTGALMPEEEQSGRVVRMWVRREHRRQGLGTLLLSRLIDEARRRGYRRVVLETTETWSDAVRFYTARGFSSLGVRDGDRHLSLDLADTPD